MHAVLRVQEILSNIFGHCYSPLTSLPCGADLAALARTCRTFKEPALDILWSELRDLSPLPRCLPEICSQHENEDLQETVYGFSRPLQGSEWRTLRSYTCRIWRICSFHQGLYWESVRPITNTPGLEPLFPNVRYLYCSYEDEIAPLLCLPFPSLTTLRINFSVLEDFWLFEDTLESFTKFSPSISNLDISAFHPMFTIGGLVSNHVCCWSNLRAVDCSAIALGVDALIHLSRMSTLISLSFTPSTTLLNKVSSWHSPLTFSGLRSFTVNSEFLTSITSLFSTIQLPAITSFGAYFHSRPSKENLASFFGSLQTHAVTSAIEQLRLIQVFDYEEIYFDPEPRGPNPSILCSDDLHPLMAFDSLEEVHLDLAWNVGLVDSELLLLGRTWCNLHQLSINREWGWVTPRITPQGLAEFVRTCPSLTMIDLAIDTRSFTELPPNLSPNLMASTDSCALSLINVIDSTIEKESISAMAAFFARIVCPVNFYFGGWNTGVVHVYRHSDMGLYERRWEKVHALTKKMIRKEYSNFVKTSGTTRIDAYLLEHDDV